MRPVCSKPTFAKSVWEDEQEGCDLGHALLHAPIDHELAVRLEIVGKQYLPVFQTKCDQEFSEETLDFYTAGALIAGEDVCIAFGIVELLEFGIGHHVLCRSLSVVDFGSVDVKGDRYLGWDILY